MEKRLMPSLMLSSIVLLPAVFTVTDAEMQVCFRAHAQLMQKPALRTLVTCWRAHGYLMQR